MADDYTPPTTEAEWKTLATTELTHLTNEEQERLPGDWDEWIARVKRDAKAEAWDAFRESLAGHLNLATPRAWGFHHPCDPPGVRWEPTERDKALMDVADMLRKDTANPYRDTHYPEGEGGKP